MRNEYVICLQEFSQLQCYGILLKWPTTDRVITNIKKGELFWDTVYTRENRTNN